MQMQSIAWFKQRLHPLLQAIGSLLLMACVWLGWLEQGAIAVPATKALSQQPAIAVNVSLGNAANQLVFEPSELEFQSGQRYKLILTNPSATKHYFTAKDFADNIWSQKVEAGNVEVKGAIHELELRPKAVAEWLFVPIKPGQYELHCTVAGHAAAGMRGTLTITVPNAST